MNSPGAGASPDLQIATTHTVPPRRLIERAVAAALASLDRGGELTVRIVDADEAQALNRRYRGIDRPTNVLSFAAEGLDEIAPDFLGDIVLCAPLVASEAAAQGKAADAHWTHLLVHGVLHLLGFDHADEDEAAAMEALECRVLSSLGLPDPYQGTNEN